MPPSSASARVLLTTGDRELVKVEGPQGTHEFVILTTRAHPQLAPPYCLVHRSRGCWGGLTFTERAALSNATPED